MILNQYDFAAFYRFIYQKFTIQESLLDMF